MMPIPKKLLIHKVLHERINKKDRWGAVEEADTTEVTKVRIEPINRIARDKNNAEIQLEAILFFDCKNSRPAGFKFAEDDVISFGDNKYRVQSVELLYDGEKLHHYELGLVKGA